MTRPARSPCNEINSAYEVGRALNPVWSNSSFGGAWMGVSHALYETTEPYYPDREPRRRKISTPT
jgi:CO/xanthine dehydrogenase Mo-binding subunit